MKRRPGASKLSPKQWDTIVKPMILAGDSYSKVAERVLAELGVEITSAAIGYRVRSEGWLLENQTSEANQEEGPKRRSFKDLAIPSPEPLTGEIEDSIVRRRCDNGHVWMGPSRIVIHQKCPLCSVRKREKKC